MGELTIGRQIAAKDDYNVLHSSAVAAACAAIVLSLLWLGVFVFFLVKRNRKGSRKAGGEQEAEAAREQKVSVKSQGGQANVYEAQIPDTPGEYERPPPLDQVETNPRWIQSLLGFTITTLYSLFTQYRTCPV